MVAHKGSRKVVNMGFNIGVNMGVNLGVNIGVNIGVNRVANMDVNMVVDLKDGRTQRFKLNLTLFHNLEKKATDRLTNGRSDNVTSQAAHRS